MALIEYVEPINLFGLFAGIGELILVIVFAWIMYRVYLKLIQFVDILINREIKYEILEETSLDEIAKKKGLDLNQELIKRKIISQVTKRKSFRKRIEDQVYENMFGKDKE